MRKPLHLLAISLCSQLCYGQRTDTLVLFYKPDQFTISKLDRQRLDSFVVHGWDRISINGYTDETEGEEYNLELSSKRSGEVYKYFTTKNFAGSSVTSKYFGEAMPRADNNTDEGLALNRRTEIIGYRFARIAPRSVVDQMSPVTKTLDNGFIITYRPGSIPAYMADNFESGSGIDFQVISNTLQMRQNNFFNNTTRGEILSSVLIVCGERLNPCKLDSPILLRIPIPVKTNCPIEKVKFFSTVAENGKRIWQEQSKQFLPEVIDGRKYIRIWMDNFCECINFDFKIDPECYDTDSTQIQYVNTTIKRLSTELSGLNSIYLPRKISDSTYKILYLKDKLNDASLTFSVYKGKRRIKSFRNQLLTTFPFDETTRTYVLSTTTLSIYFPRLKVTDVILKVNGDKYWIQPEKNKYDFVYLNRKTENILVDFTIVDGRGRVTQIKNQPITSIPYDENKKLKVVDKKFLKQLKEESMVAGL